MGKTLRQILPDATERYKISETFFEFESILALNTFLIFWFDSYQIRSSLFQYTDILYSRSIYFTPLWACVLMM